jgi:hypothetical protein
MISASLKLLWTRRGFRCWWRLWRCCPKWDEMRFINTLFITWCKSILQIALLNVGTASWKLFLQKYLSQKTLDNRQHQLDMVLYKYLPSEFSRFLLPSKFIPAEPASESGWLRAPPPRWGDDGIIWPAWFRPAGLVGGWMEIWIF